MKSLLPLENIVYLGDTARLPYGTKSSKTVTGYSLKNTRFLASKNSKIIVAACNTASAYSIEVLSDEFDVPVLGVIEPGAKKAREVSRNGKIGVIATPSTVKSRAYERALRREDSLLKTVSAACPLFVPLVEEGWGEDEIAFTAARRYLEPLVDEGIDTLILGCTHYPLMKKVVSEVMGGGVTLVDSATEAATETAKFMESAGLLNKNGKGTAEFYLTDGSESFVSAAGKFLGGDIGKAEIVDL